MKLGVVVQKSRLSLIFVIIDAWALIMPTYLRKGGGGGVLRDYVPENFDKKL
jgi:hypothetical protein